MAFVGDEGERSIFDFLFFYNNHLYEKLDQKAKFILNFFTEKGWVKEKNIVFS